ncbi:hypothetical protein [Flavobacterium frigoris]|uniref:Uncharacterized protein n=1 Tax=Flavobacterium frigoris (strain PS1) TaxID=1086011 RepID=H7FRH5_FLAFP|nr:hypothetical protein [Flavobacterium frigoris]EIA08958.1 hypothetical protein HJ01_01724 [Flavobacterium frigoris PS1]
MKKARSKGLLEKFENLIAQIYAEVVAALHSLYTKSIDIPNLESEKFNNIW